MRRFPRPPLRAGLALAAALALLLHAATGLAEAPPALITIDNFTFAPTALDVAVGTTVIWENRDDIPHTVTDADATPPGYKSQPLDTGDRFSRTFATPGTYRYFCSLHAHMTGTVVVK